ncbi:hypothetical protein CWE09_04825 [Aliidiomarina minuta]|uniref:Alpha/beta-hydrolase catalytic domain-containing protein n=1 Tax=Aliidiomarina minuta TaxID=880057 RepID=A0A432W7J5_9GAMM|nr:alpha/beta-hydrolase family protein [Aliidiomarina minuta]RUO26054.1 hypothetical protein CWE09_04825 [Aliidiomarina minuta]
MQKSSFFCTTGWLVGIFFFALSLTPTLLPRTDLVQGLISGFSLAAGYGVGVFLRWLWGYLQLPLPTAQAQRYVHLIAGVLCAAIAFAFLWQASTWQNSVRLLMGMEDDVRVRALLVGLVALLVFFAILLMAKLFRRTFLFLAAKLQRFIPSRVSHMGGLIIAFFVFWSVIDGVFFSFALRTADRTYQEVDLLLEPEVEQPGDALKTGSEASLIDWQGLGRHGRRFVVRGPSQEDISDFTGDDQAFEPIRVYVGVNSAETPEERAQFALQELLRVDAFQRSTLVLITPTGTGWVDPAAINTLEYLQRGDIASVTAQYSYLPSPLSLVLEGDYGVETARALFQAVYTYWSDLPTDERPRLYLHGLSLGALNSDRSFDFYDVIDDPFHGALWSGPPFRSETWRNVTARREAGSAAWLPRFRDESVVRFMNQYQGLQRARSEWGSFRIAYLQYASDPVTFFEPQAFYREPDWMREPRGPDVSPDLRWFPIVTGLQLAADLAAGTSPPGYGHEYAAEHYIDAWLALTEPEGWQEADIQRLKALFATDH